MVLETDGSAVYKDWVAGGTHWSDSSIKNAWVAWGNLVHGTLDKASSNAGAHLEVELCWHASKETPDTEEEG